jgi:hypothetical protein
MAAGELQWVYPENSSQNFPLSPPAFQASLQTSTFQARNRLTGFGMSLTRKSDVKNHLSARGRAGNGPFLSVSQPGATGFSAAESAEIKNDPGPVENSTIEHLLRGINIVPAVPGSLEK